MKSCVRENDISKMTACETVSPGSKLLLGWFARSSHLSLALRVFLPTQNLYLLNCYSKFLLHPDGRGSLAVAGR